MKQHRKRIRSMALVAAFCLLFSSLGFLTSSAVGTPSVTVNGKTLPLNIEKYKPGDYYNTRVVDGKSVGCDHDAYDVKHCILYEPTTGWGFPAGWQCYGFALDVFHRVFGYDVSDATIHKVHWSCATTAEFKANMQSIPAGSMVRAVTRRTRSNHAFILMKVTSEQVWVYQCNMYNACEVTAEIYTYSKFVEDFYEIWYYVTPCNHSRTYTQYNAYQHKIACSECRYSDVAEGHTYVSRPNNMLRCTGCGFTKSAPGGIVRIDDEQEI